MTAPALTLEVLPAGFGDCLLVSCVRDGGAPWRLLVDTGPDETYPALRARLLALPRGADGHRHIDLFVVSHIDHDHIGAARLLLDDRELDLSFDDIWFNAPRVRTRGVAEGQQLAQLLGASDRRLPWNIAFGGGPVVTPAEGGGVELRGAGLPVLTLLSPTPERLDRLYRVWARELERLRRKEREAPAPPTPALRGPAPSLEELARRPTPLDAAVANGSSIAFLLEHRGASVLLAADAFATVLVPALRSLSERRGSAGALGVDAFKLSHHGSSANVTRELLEAVQSSHYIVSTNNTHFDHPDDEAIARVVTTAPSPTLWFNYDTPRNRRWTTAELCARHGHGARYPQRPGLGVSLDLPARDAAPQRSAR